MGNLVMLIKMISKMYVYEKNSNITFFVAAIKFLTK